MKFIKAPSSILLKDRHLNPTILFLAELIKFNKEILALDFSEIHEMRQGDLLVFAAQIEKSITTNRNKIIRKGALPKTKSIRKLLTKVDNVFHINKPINIPEVSNAEKENLLNPTLIDNIVNDLKKIGIKEYYYPFNVFLTELIGNAVEHGIENRKINWWLTSEVDNKNRIAKYTFVDMGLGIISSHKKAGLPWKYYFKNSIQILLGALSGELGSSTKESNRGKGLPQLRDMIVKENVSDLILITNDVSLNFQNGSFVVRRNPNFVGTYYSWTIDHNNYQIWKNSQ